MTKFPDNIAFKFAWRDYQQNVLDELQQHLVDQHLHLIAPPGSGKTVIGLEIARLINQPTLILAPTIALRNQWISRFCSLFLPSPHQPDWISTDIRNPKFLTVSTYQGLYAACTQSKAPELEWDEETDASESELSKIVPAQIKLIQENLKSLGIKTLVLDEAHHLKNQWWQVLIEIKKYLNPFLVALTATPPFDSSALEYHRYLSLNGEIDLEISIPELVKSGDLCVHQDLVHLSTPTAQEQLTIEALQKNLQNAFQSTLNDPVLIQAIQYLINGLPNEAFTNWVQAHFALFLRCFHFLNFHRSPISPEKLEIVGNQPQPDAPPAAKALEQIVQYYLFEAPPHLAGFARHQEELQNRLKRAGALHQKQITFEEHPDIALLLGNGLNKLNAIHEIVSHEISQMDKNLRMVILSDFIRKEYLSNASENNLQLSKLGVIPIFEYLRRNIAQPDAHLGVLSGSTIILPKSVTPQLTALLKDKISIKSLPYDDRFIWIQSPALHHDIVQKITHLFEEGHFTILIGTKSLLGEGWDAPAVNSIILASFVGSFVQSNQMRGRAIRRNEQGDKTANIWHLVSAQPNAAEGGADIKLLERRFKHFIGINPIPEPILENGISRLALPTIFNAESIHAYNEFTFQNSQNRTLLHEKWNHALGKGIHLVEELKVPNYILPTFSAKKTIIPRINPIETIDAPVENSTNLVSARKVATGTFLGSLAALKPLLAVLVPSIATFLPISIPAITVIAGGTILGLPSFLSYQIFKSGKPITSVSLIEKIALLLRHALINEKIFTTPSNRLKVVVHKDAEENTYCYLTGGTGLEKRIFLNCMTEILSPVAQQKYILGKLDALEMPDVTYNSDYYFTIPDLLGRNRKMAEQYLALWNQRICPATVYYTKNKSVQQFLIRNKVRQGETPFTLSQVHRWVS